MKSFLFALGHPAHFHLYKNVIQALKEKGHTVSIVISDKDILKKLLENASFQFTVIAAKKQNEQITDKLFKLIRSSIELNRIVKQIKPDLMIGCLTQIGVVGAWNRIPTFFNAEDDINYTFLQALLVYPFVKYIVAPELTNVSFFNYKKIAYKGYQKLAYLHPNRFTPDENKIKLHAKRYFILRLAKLDAYHDLSITGLNDYIVKEIIEILKDSGEILISSEREIPDEFKKYTYNDKIENMHHYLSYADLYIGDSQSMAVEAALLGTPGIRYNKFADKISIISELENIYNLTTSIHSKYPEILKEKIKTFAANKDLKHEFIISRDNMLKDKIDVTAFLVWFVENYPKSFKTMKENPNYQYNFK